jgi:hypothetical protein
MKKLLSTIFIVSVVLTSCGPAAEDRVQMDRVAKRMSDSLQHLIDSSLADPMNTLNEPPQTVTMPQPTANPANK